MSYYIGPVQYDVLLLIGPLVAVILAGTVVLQGKAETKTKIAWLMTVLMLFMGLEIFNTQQGGFAVGIVGAFLGGLIVQVMTREPVWFITSMQSRLCCTALARTFGSACVRLPSL